MGWGRVMLLAVVVAAAVRLLKTNLRAREKKRGGGRWLVHSDCKGTIEGRVVVVVVVVEEVEVKLISIPSFVLLLLLSSPLSPPSHPSYIMSSSG